MRDQKIQKLLSDGIDIPELKQILKNGFLIEDIKIKYDSIYLESIEVEKTRFNELKQANEAYTDTIQTLKENAPSFEYYKAEYIENIDAKIEEKLNSFDEYKAILKEQAVRALDITEISKGLRFYTNTESIGDIRDAIDEGNELNLLDTHEIEWKTADGIKWVTFADLKEARKTRLENKAKLVGVE